MTRSPSCLPLVLLAGSMLLIPACARKQPPPEPRERLDASLIEAVKANRLADVKDLLHRGASPNAFQARTHDGLTALIFAVSEGHQEVVQALIAGGADVNFRQYGTFDGLTPLMFAAGTDRPDIVNLLIEHGAKVNRRTDINGLGPTALNYAVQGGHIGPVTLLLAEGAAIECRDLEAAISGGHVDIAERLFLAGADPCWRFSGSGAPTLLDQAQRSPKDVRAKMVAMVRAFMGTQRVPDDREGRRQR